MQGRSTLREEVESFFRFALEQCEGHSELEDFAKLLATNCESVNQPMRVALVGKTNAGKSTMVNAFLGQELAATGNGELTFNISWFKYGERNRLVVHMIDGNIDEQDFANLEELTTHYAQDRELLERIQFVEVQCPNPLLKTFDLIDTPGLHSFYEKDSRNTQQLLTSPDSRPHALVFLFSGTLQEPDLRELERFHSSCGNTMSGLTAIGALTKVDDLPNVFEDGRRSLQQLLQNHPKLQRYFYNFFPVIGPAASGAQRLDAENWQDLQQLAQLTPEDFRKVTRAVSFFCEREYEGIGVPSTARRERLYKKLGMYGIRQAVQELSAAVPPEEIPAKLLAASGVGVLRSILLAHFGNRAFLIKSRVALSAVRAQAFRLSQQLSGEAVTAVRQIVSRIDVIVGNELRFREFAVLERYYAGALLLDTEEVGQLLAVTGENGCTCAQRLGQTEDTPLENLIALANRRARYWQGRTNEVMASVDAQEGAEILAESYVELSHRIAEARDHLAAAAKLLTYEL